jgi:hypothetical protein
MNYRGYYIHYNGFSFEFWEGDESNYYHDGEHDNACSASSVDDAKKQIDDLLLHVVVTKFRVHDHEESILTMFDSLIDALKYTHQENGILLTEFTDM